MTAVSDRLDAIQQRLDTAAPGAITITPSDVAWLRDTARKQQASIDAVRALADQWNARGESDMAFSKTIPDENISIALLTDGATMVENARHIRNALEAQP
ncbi:hypothetical protein HYQ00_gp73 [Arthrobacter phage TripleJ]|uniref:Uncharacterized protein n=1 Tax=Arthrobacter phage TripleJ TaxID=2599838 RepID=A0A5J6TI59_9CAUD|nr:hypothetical protein HYQ00_gp73 [Arthrobacter phage TripleJ]QFG09617.1 hypothetical protein PBI_TRIPLEJ_73 [Arthrobacter phage TripleJ]